MKIVIAPDSFKGSVSAQEAALSIERGVRRAYTHAETVLVPVADGGEGTMENLVAATNGQEIEVAVTGPLGLPVQAKFGVLGDQQTCVIEMASASGLHTIEASERNPLKATTYGTGELIKRALDMGYRDFVLALGGSATNDGGAGMLQALGLKLLDQSGREIGYGGGELEKLAQVESEQLDQRIKESHFLIASDVDNPFIGENGASYVFGPQKGATPEMVEILDHNLSHWADLIEETTNIRVHDRPGAGAAGGIGGAFQAFFPAEMKRGIDVVLDYMNLAEKLVNADLVITGEGQVDFQTAYGKTPMGVAEMAKKQHVPTIIVAGSVGEKIEALYPYGVIGIYSMVNGPMKLEEAIDNAEILLEQVAEQLCRTYFYNRQ
ncbi:glycerate kinase [Lederbergia galactosidilytica]|uniref:Glycerate kinase n=1 Tax=Lederbergia galactosidilytica TaxID=217031 RepID=A0A178A704_9BACI|nr:glycerate kinase [Lederbergia galactosidilytica]KRG16179.1 glycerate kinase [Virgibacillus soli]OAK75609.1 glycerate kinase [Lederbergia galactosidilytica]